MFIRQIFFLSVIAILLFATEAPAATTAQVDDSATVVLDGTPRMTWRLVPPKNRDNTIVGRTRVNIRLTTSPWIGKVGKIYMLLPAESASSVKIKWRSQGRLLEGQLAPGGRTLVYAGPIRDARLEDVFDINIEADGSRISNIQRLRFYFEIDVD
jgi:hypothetical protein